MLDTLSVLCQIAIPLMTGLSVFMLARTDRWCRWGYVVGLAAQPFWYYATITAGQWGMLLLTVWLTYSWGRGVWNRFHTG